MHDAKGHRALSIVHFLIIVHQEISTTYLMNPVVVRAMCRTHSMVLS